MKNSKPLAEKRTEVERMQDVRLLIDHLARSQETTIKLILDCLYDVGATNLIHQKVGPKSLQRLSKSVASLSKPAFRIIAYTWFKANCPQLITDWLHKKVSFGVKPTTAESLDAQTVEVLAPEPIPPQIVAAQEVKRLRAQVRILAGMLIGSVAIFGGTALWLFYGPASEAQRLQGVERSVAVDDCRILNTPECLP